jgi:DNA-binding NtrC family response regulator
MSELATMPRHNLGESSSAGSVLIIDDEAAIRESLETLLEMEGYEVQSAASADRKPALRPRPARPGAARP